MCSVASPSNSSAPSKSSQTDTEAPEDLAGTDAQRISSLLTYVACTDAFVSPKRHRAPLNGWKPVPSTRTYVEPVCMPLLGLTPITCSGVWYANTTPLRLYCCPFMVTSTTTSDAASCEGDAHVRFASPATTARTT